MSGDKAAGFHGALCLADRNATDRAMRGRRETGMHAAKAATVDQTNSLPPGFTMEMPLWALPNVDAGK